MDFKNANDMRNAIDQMLKMQESLKKEYAVAAFSVVKRVISEIGEYVDNRIKVWEKIDLARPTAAKYKIKSEYVQLFKNLSSGEEFFQRDAFLDASKPQGKAYVDLSAALEDEKVLGKLVNAGFVNMIDTGITFIPKGGD